MALAGQVIFGGMRMRELFTDDLDLVALCQGEHPALEREMAAVPGADSFRLEIASLDHEGGYAAGVAWPRNPDRSGRQPKPAPELLAPAARLLGLKPELGRPVSIGDVGEVAEAVWETPRGMTIVHTQKGTVGLVLAGRVLFSRLLLAREHPEAEVESYAVATSPDAVVTRLLRSFEGCDALEDA